MAYLNTIPDPNFPVPAVWGLGAVRVVPMRRRRRGMGDASDAVSQYLDSVLAGFASPSQANALMNTGSPNLAALGDFGISPGMTSPADAANQVYFLAANFCGVAADNTQVTGAPTPQGCTDQGNAAAAAAYPKWLAYYASLPQSVWKQLSTFNATPQYSCTFPDQPKYGPEGQFVACVNVGTGQPSGQQPTTYLPTQAPVAQAIQSFAPPVQQQQVQQQQGAKATAVQLVNMSRPGQPFVDGDQFQVTVSGSPNVPVTATLDGGAPGNMGTTDSTGKLPIVGNFSTGDIGSHTEVWQAGSGSPATLSFSVAGLPASTSPNGGTQNNTSGGSQQQQPLLQLPQLDTSWLTADVNLFGMEVPVWGIAAGVLGLLIFMPRGR